MAGQWSPPVNFEKRPVAVLGGGVLGRRIATCWAAGSWPVRIYDPSKSQNDEALEYARSQMGTYTALTQREPGPVETCEDLPSAVRDCWLVIEAVPEKLEIKLSTFADLEKHAPKDCILASNSSSYKSREMVARVDDETKARCLNTHYMMPPEALVVELMTDGWTHNALFPWLAERHMEVGLHPLVARKESTGFVFNRIWAAIKRETLSVLAEGVSVPADIDRVFKELYGARVGPCHLMDNVGLDTVSFIEEHYVKERNLPRQHLDWLERNFIEEGKLGSKSNKGGLYEKPKAGSQTKLIFLNLGAGEPLRNLKDKQSLADTMHRGQILSLNVDEGGKPQELLGHAYLPDGLDVCHSDNRMYWTDMGNASENDGQVLSARLDGTDLKTVVPPGAVHTPKQCVIDQDAQKLYFCDREGMRVMRVNLDGTGHENLVKNADWETDKEKGQDLTNWCVGIAISKKLGKFFWTQKGPSKGNQGRIFCAGLNMPQGADASTRNDIDLVIGDLPEPIDLVFDDEESALYWTDRGELPLGNTLNKKIVGAPPSDAEKPLGRQILAQGFCEAIGLRLDKGKDCLWVCDMGGHIWKCNPHVPSLKQKIYEGETSSFSGMAMIKV